MPTNVYGAAEVMIRERLLARPQARGRGKSADFIEKAVRIGIWILRKHGPYGARIFSACREVLKKLFGFTCRAIVDALEQIGLLRFLPRANGHERKFRSPEYAAFQFEIGLDFALLFPAALSVPANRPDKGQEALRDCLGFAVSGRLVPARTWDRARPELRLPSRASVKRAASATLEALQRVPVPRLSHLALATLKRPAGFYGR